MKIFTGRACKSFIPFITVAAVFISIAATAQSPDTLSLTINQAEKRFIDSNLQLLAAHYNVDAQKALIEQAKVWDNPVLNTDHVIAANGAFMPSGKLPDGSLNNQYFIQVEQLIKTAGKRGKLINIATTNSKLSELQLQDVLRNLRYQLHIDYYTIAQQLMNLSTLQEQQKQLTILLNGMQAQFSAGNIAQKELLRVQALQISLQQDITDLHKSIADNQADLKSLLQIKDPLFVKPTDPLTADVSLPDNLVNIIKTGTQTNPNYLLQQTTILYQQQNLAYQKALRVPDVTLSPNFDRNSNYAPNYWGLGLSLPLPVFDRNKGNIKAAEFSIKQQQAITTDAETGLINDISNAYNKLSLTIAQNNTTQRDFYEKYQTMFSNMFDSYQHKQISLLEFLDFFNDYTEIRQRLVQQQLNLALAKEELNYHVGSDVIK